LTARIDLDDEGLGGRVLGGRAGRVSGNECWDQQNDRTLQDAHGTISRLNLVAMGSEARRVDGAMITRSDWRCKRLAGEA
jgi:hypothetical protein